MAKFSDRLSFKGSRKQKLSIIVIILIPLCCCCSCLFIYIFGSLLPPQLKLLSKNSNVWSANEPAELLKLQCTAAYKVSINDQQLSQNEITDLCGTNGYKVDLENGENIFDIKAQNNSGNSTNLQLKVNFDITAYNQRLKEEAEKQKQAELDKQKEEADAKAKAEADAKAKSEADAKALKDWKSTYQNVKDNIINKAISTSESVINSYSNGSDFYRMRTLAKQAEDYFYSCTSINLKDKLAPVPESMNSNVNDLQTRLADFCLSNEGLAQAVVKYAEADTTSRQYSALDDVKTYGQNVASTKFDLQLDVEIIEELLK